MSSGFCCHLVHRESLFLVVVANLYYCKCAVINNTIISYILYRTNDDKSVPAAIKFPQTSFYDCIGR